MSIEAENWDDGVTLVKQDYLNMMFYYFHLFYSSFKTDELATNNNNEAVYIKSKKRGG